MKLEQTSLSIRERSQIEVFDIAFLLIKQNARGLLMLFIVFGIPFSLLMTWMGCSTSPMGMIHLSLLCSILPQCFLPTWLGPALFVSDTSLLSLTHRGKMRASFFRSFASDIVLTLSIVGLLIRAWKRYFAFEVFGLEGVDGAAARQRMRAIHQRSYIGAMLSNGAVGLLIAVSVYLSVAGIRGLISGSLIIETDPYYLFEQFSFWLGISIGMFYCGVSHFLLYINHRTTYEGWDLYLQARRCAKESELP